MSTESQLQDEALRSHVRERIEDGRLPVMLPKAIFAGYGSGKPCLACDRPITHTQIEYEVDHDENGSLHRLRMHLGCYVIWQIECQKRVAQERR